MLCRRLLLFSLMLGAGRAPAADSLQWGAIADGSTFDVSSGNLTEGVGGAAVAFGFGPTEGLAIQNAVAACRARAEQERIPVTCVISRVWEEGCGYAILGGGHLPNGQGVEEVGAGETREDAQGALRQLLRGVTDLKMGDSHGSCLGTALTR
jgi:hypothetical protein